MAMALSSVPTPYHAVQALRSELKSRFIERDEVIDGLLCALLARQHVLLLGPPGTAKSALVNAVTDTIEGARCFSWLLTKFSTPEEVFGPISLSGLQQDCFTRVTTGKLPEAHIGFVDEVFKASSAILNAMLSIANERVFHDDGQVRACPLVTLVGASNELPHGDEGLGALFDRFLLRLDVRYVRERGGQTRLLGDAEAPGTATIELGDLEAAQAMVERVAIDDDTIALLLAVKAKLEEESFIASDRRWRQMLSILRARAWLEGASAVDEEHIVDVLPDCLWADPKDRSAIVAIVGAIANPGAARITELVDAAKEVVSDLGPPTVNDANARAEWLMNASLAVSRLEEMGDELGQLAKKNGGARLDAANKTVAAARQDIAERVSQLYRL
jgi:MoxR-like ATPase